MLDEAHEAKGKIWYGMHFYAGLAQYSDEGKDPYRVFLNEDTIRGMDQSFAGRPVFVFHVDVVQTDLDVLRQQADGWVIESFYNKADGKHWVKFITVSEKADQAIESGMRLSNCYLPERFGPAGLWNGIDYSKEITAASYEHLAIVDNPRYEESIILSPDEFKKYNEEKNIELIKIANHIKKEESPMKFNVFKRSKVENTLELESLVVELPRSKKEVRLTKLINAADEEEMEKDKPKVADPDHLVEVHGNTMSVGDLVKAHKKLLEDSKKEDSEDDEDEEDDRKEDEDHENADEDEEDEEDEKDCNEDEEHENADEDEEDEEDEKDCFGKGKNKKNKKKNRKKNALRAAARLRNAPSRAHREIRPELSLSTDQVARGKALFGSK